MSAPASPMASVDLSNLRRAQYDHHVCTHLPDATGDASIQPGDSVTLPDGRVLENVDLYPKSVDSKELLQLRNENQTLRNQLAELRMQPQTDAAFQTVFEEEFGSSVKPVLKPRGPDMSRLAAEAMVPRGTFSGMSLSAEAKLQEALIELAKSGGLDAAAARVAVQLISDMIRY